MRRDHDRASQPLDLAERLEAPSRQARRPQRAGDQEPIAHRRPVTQTHRAHAQEILRLAPSGRRRVQPIAPPHSELILDMRRHQPPEQQPPLRGFDNGTDQRLQVPRELGLADACLADRQPNENERAKPQRIDSRRLRARRVQYRHRHVLAP